MTKILTLDEMLDVLTSINHPTTRTCQLIMEAVGTVMAETIAGELHVISSVATFEGAAFAGTCARFFPAFKGQPCPEPLSHFDQDEWDAGEADDSPPRENASPPPSDQANAPLTSDTSHLPAA